MTQSHLGNYPLMRTVFEVIHPHIEAILGNISFRSHQRSYYLIKMSCMSANYIFGKQQNMIKSHFLFHNLLEMGRESALLISHI